MASLYFQSPKRFIDELPSDPNLSVVGLIGINNIVSWLTDLIIKVHRYNRCWYLRIILPYNGTESDSLVDYVKSDKTPLIRSWLAILQEAKLNLHDHFRDTEEYLDQGRLSDVEFCRQGIKRILEVEYGTDPTDIIISVRTCELKKPPEDCIPGAWDVGETYLDTGSMVIGLKPMANWLISTNEDWNTRSDS